MYTVLSVSDDVPDRHWQRLLLEGGGYEVVSASHAAEASYMIQVAGIDAVVLGTKIGVDDRTRLSLLAVTHKVPVVCMCGLRSEPGCPVVHILPYDASIHLLQALAQLLGLPHFQRTIPSRAPC